MWRSTKNNTFNYRERSDLVEVNIFVGELYIWRKNKNDTYRGQNFSSYKEDCEQSAYISPPEGCFADCLSWFPARRSYNSPITFPQYIFISSKTASPLTTCLSWFAARRCYNSYIHFPQFLMENRCDTPWDSLYINCSLSLSIATKPKPTYSQLANRQTHTERNEPIRTKVKSDEPCQVQQKACKLTKGRMK